jgi:hypothetical protein
VLGYRKLWAVSDHIKTNFSSALQLKNPLQKQKNQFQLSEHLFLAIRTIILRKKRKYFQVVIWTMFRTEMNQVVFSTKQSTVIMDKALIVRIKQRTLKKRSYCWTSLSIRDAGHQSDGRGGQPLECMPTKFVELL